ncbi:uroporphyrinogen decarboxylase family protein, partial [Acidobacteriota bacterium]
FNLLKSAPNLSLTCLVNQHMSVDAMTSKERMAKTMSLEVPDRVPVMCQMSIGHMLLQTGIRPLDFWFAKEALAEGLLEMRDIYNFDGILISLHGHSPVWMKDIDRIQSEGDKEIIIWQNGDRTVFPKDDLPQHYLAEKKYPPQITEFDPDSLPSEIDFIPVTQGLDFQVDLNHTYDIFNLINEKVGDSFSIHGEVTSPFDYYLHLFGIKNAMINLIEEPTKSKDILQRYTDGIKKIAIGQVEHSVDAIKLSSPYAGANFISLQFYREFVLPYEGQIIQEIRSRNVHAYLHTCGAINDRLELMAESGASGIECLDPPPLGNVSLEEAKKRIGDRMFIKGNVDPVNTLLHGNLEEVGKDASDRIAVGKQGRGFILSTACSIAPCTKRENIQFLARLVDEYGQY